MMPLCFWNSLCHNLASTAQVFAALAILQIVLHLNYLLVFPGLRAPETECQAGCYSTQGNSGRAPVWPSHTAQMVSRSDFLKLPAQLLLTLLIFSDIFPSPRKGQLLHAGLSLLYLNTGGNSLGRLGSAEPHEWDFFCGKSYEPSFGTICSF